MTVGPNSLHIEASVANSEPMRGFTETEKMFLGLWYDANNAPLSAATAPNLETLGTLSRCAKWDHNESGAIRYQVTLPDWYANQDKMELSLYARKVDATDENTDLALQAQVLWWTPGVDTSDLTNLISVSQTLAGSVAGSDLSGFAKYTFDFGAEFAENGSGPQRGDCVVILLAPNEAVGSADMDLQVLDAPLLTFQRHLSLFTRTDRLID